MTTPTPGQPLSEADVSLQVGDRVIARADLRKHPDGPVFIAKGDEVQITDQYGINNCIAVVALSDGQTGAWAKSCFERPHAPVSRPGDGVEGESTDDLVDRFAEALKAKLRTAGEKYGFDDAWKQDDWREKLIEDLWAHVQKGDPRDVAAYCAFAWHHGWSLSLDDAGSGWSEYEDELSDAIGDSIDMDWTSRIGARAVVRWLDENHPRPKEVEQPCLNADEKAAQAGRCACRGADDYCPCQNAPDRQTVKDRSNA